MMILVTLTYFLRLPGSYNYEKALSARTNFDQTGTDTSLGVPLEIIGFW